VMRPLILTIRLRDSTLEIVSIRHERQKPGRGNKDPGDQ